MSLDDELEEMTTPELRALGDALYEEAMKDIAAGTASQELIRAVNNYRAKVKMKEQH